MRSAHDPLAVLELAIADPPAVHTMGPGSSELGVWSTDRDLYELLVGALHPGAVTLETGSGISTVVFAAAGARHTCVTPIAEEQTRLSSWAERNGVPLDGVRFVIGPSDEVLPHLELDAVADVVLIDGGHGFPVPSIDWYYGARFLRDGGLLLVDDLHLASVGMLVDFLDRDPRWRAERVTAKWAAYRRVGTGSLRLEHNRQPWYQAGRAGDLGVRELSRLLVAAAARSARRRAARLRQRRTNRAPQVG